MTEVQTPRGALKAVRDELLSKEVKTMRVGRYDDPQIMITYRPLTQGEWTASFDLMMNSDAKGEERLRISKDANSDLLIKACTGIELRGTTLNDKFPGFGPELGELLGIDTDRATARRVCQDLFLTDGDMIAHVNELARWSNLTNQRVEEDFSGE